MSNTFEKNKKIPTSEVKPKQAKRRFSSAYKLDIVKQAELCRANGEPIGGLLRREGLYSSHLTKWRQQKDQGLLSSTSAPKQGRKPESSPNRTDYEKLQRDYQALEQRFKQAQAIIDVQKKVSEIFGVTLNPAQTSD